MKKLLVLMLGLVLALTFVACGDDEPKKTEDPSVDSSTPSTNIENPSSEDPSSIPTEAPDGNEGWTDPAGGSKK